jgi:hypothetical protein
MLKGLSLKIIFAEDRMNGSFNDRWKEQSFSDEGGGGQRVLKDL